MAEASEFCRKMRAVVKLNVRGERMSVAQSTLQQHGDNVLSVLASGRWQQDGEMLCALCRRQLTDMSGQSTILTETHN